MCMTSTPRQDDTSTPEVLEAHHRPDNLLDCAVVMLHYVVCIFVPSDLYEWFPLRVRRLKSGQGRAAIIDDGGSRHGVWRERLLAVALCRKRVAAGAQQEVNGAPELMRRRSLAQGSAYSSRLLLRNQSSDRRKCNLSSLNVSVQARSSDCFLCFQVCGVMSRTSPG